MPRSRSRRGHRRRTRPSSSQARSRSPPRRPGLRAGPCCCWRPTRPRAGSATIAGWALRYRHPNQNPGPSGASSRRRGLAAVPAAGEPLLAYSAAIAVGHGMIEMNSRNSSVRSRNRRLTRRTALIMPVVLDPQRAPTVTNDDQVGGVARPLAQQFVGEARRVSAGAAGPAPAASSRSRRRRRSAPEVCPGPRGHFTGHGLTPARPRGAGRRGPGLSASPAAPGRL